MEELNSPHRALMVQHVYHGGVTVYQSYTPQDCCIHDSLQIGQRENPYIHSLRSSRAFLWVREAQSCLKSDAGHYAVLERVDIMTAY